MSELATGTLSVAERQVPATDYLPEGNELQARYQLELSTFSAPTSARLANSGERADIIELVYDLDEAANTPLDIARLHRSYMGESAWGAVNDSWWKCFAEHLERYAVEPQQAKNLYLHAKHSANITVDGQPTAQGFEIYEFGAAAQNPLALRKVFETLGHIDQLSGGLLSADPQRPRLALLDGFRMRDNRGIGETLGSANSSFVWLNVTGISEAAQEAGDDLLNLFCHGPHSADRSNLHATNWLNSR